MKLILYAIFTIVFVAIVFTVIAYFSENNFIMGVVSSIVASVIILTSNLIIKYWKRLKFLWWKFRYYDTSIRLSISYLYRIKVGDEYFLIKGERITSQYQPVGGVYKRFKSSESFFREIEAKDDNLFSIDESNKDDLRIRIKGQYLLKFVDWFDSNKERETCPWREFYEELIETKMISQEKFPYLFSNKIKQYTYGIKFSEHTESMELLIADIYEPILNEEQLKEFQKLKEIPSDKYYFADEEQINRLGSIPKKVHNINISQTAKWTL